MTRFPVDFRGCFNCGKKTIIFLLNSVQPQTQVTSIKQNSSTKCGLVNPILKDCNMNLATLIAVLIPMVLWTNTIIQIPILTSIIIQTQTTIYLWIAIIVLTTIRMVFHGVKIHGVVILIQIQIQIWVGIIHIQIQIWVGIVQIWVRIIQILIQIWVGII